MRRAVVLLVLLGFACADAGESCDEPTLNVEADKETLASGEELTLSVTIDGFRFVDPAHGELVPGDNQPRHAEAEACEGHYHVYLDDLMTNPIVMAWEDEVTVTIDAEPGEHEVIVRINDNEHLIIKPEVTDSVMINVE